MGIPTAQTDEAGAVSLDGPLQYGVTAPHWLFTGTVGSFGVFHNTAARGWAWTRSPGGGPAPGSAVAARAPNAQGDQQIGVQTTSPTTLVRSVSWTSGWQASVRVLRFDGRVAGYGPPRAVPVLKSGVVQAVRLPSPGDYLVSFHYRPTPALAGLAASGVAGIGLAVWVVLEAVGMARRRRRGSTGTAQLSGPDPDPAHPGGSRPIAAADRA